MPITVGSLFSGIGGLDLGLEQAGMRTLWQVEYDDWAREALNQNFPHTEKFKDVREVGKHNLRPVDLICGGFPCQDVSISNIGGHGLEGERSGLWSEYKRILCELLPDYALIENVSNLLVRGIERVLSDLAIGYDAEWQTLRASSFGLPTRRKRLFIVAVSQRIGLLETPIFRDFHPHQFEPGASGAAFSDLEIGGRPYIAIPEHLRMDNGLPAELSEIEAAIKGYGNAVCPPVAKWIGERIIEFDHKTK